MRGNADKMRLPSIKEVKGKQNYFAFCGVTARNSTFPIIKVDKVKFEPYLIENNVGENWFWTVAFGDYLPHKIGLTSTTRKRYGCTDSLLYHRIRKIAV